MKRGRRRISAGSDNCLGYGTLRSAASEVLLQKPGHTPSEC